MKLTIDQLRKVKGIGEKTIERIIEQYAEPSVYDTSYKPYKAHELDYCDENNWLMYGDCLERMREIPDGSVDMVMVDVPYGTTACKWDEIIPLEPMWESINRAVKDNAAIVMTASQPFTSVLVNSNIRNFKHEWIWKKNRGSNFATLRYNPFKEHESICVFSCSSKIMFNPIKQERSESGKSRANYDFKNEGGGEAIGVIKGDGRRVIEKNLRHPSSVQKFNTEVGLHPTQKPVSLIEYLIRTYTNESETVLDFTFGSGTTGVACRNLNRKFIGIELDENYYKLGRDRILNGDK